MISPLSERRKWRLREMSSLAQGHTGSRRQVPASVSPQSLGSYRGAASPARPAPPGPSGLRLPAQHRTHGFP